MIFLCVINCDIVTKIEIKWHKEFGGAYIFVVFNMIHLKKRCLELVIIRNNVAQF